MKYILAIVLMLTPIQTASATHNSQPYTIVGRATHYECTAGWCDGTPTVALPAALGGRYIGRAHGTVLVCADRCVSLTVVDYCDCYWGTPDQRVVDLNRAAWPLVTNAPYSAGIVNVTVTFNGGGFQTNSLPDTSMK